MELQNKIQPMLLAFFCLLVAPLATGHGAVTQPKPRNAIDGNIAPWNGESVNPNYLCYGSGTTDVKDI